MKFTGKALYQFELWARGYLGRGQSSVDKFYAWPEAAQFGIYQVFADHVGIILHVGRNLPSGEFNWHIQYVGARIFQSWVAPSRTKAQMRVFDQFNEELNREKNTAN